MTDTTVGAAAIETRQSMIRVWIALSAVWVGFWMLIAAIVLATVEARFPLSNDVRPFCLIVLTPPLALLGLGVTARWLCELISRAARSGRAPRS